MTKYAPANSAAFSTAFDYPLPPGAAGRDRMSVQPYFTHGADGRF